MKRFIFPLVIVVALVASLGATASYIARVDMDVDPVVGHSWEGELAFAESSGFVADEFVKRIAEFIGGPETIYTKYRNIQADSNYCYFWVVDVTNNKPYGVCFRVKSADGELDDLNDGVGFQVWMTSDKGTNNLTCIYDEEGIDSGTYPVSWYYIGPNETHYMSFEVMTSTWQGHDLGALSPGTYEGTLEFEAQGPSTGTCPP